MCRVVLHSARIIVKALHITCIQSASPCICAGLNTPHLHYWQQDGRPYSCQCYVCRELAKYIANCPGGEKVVQLVTI